MSFFDEFMQEKSEPMEWREYIKCVRGYLELTQRNFGNLIGASIDQIKDWEIGRTYPTPLHQEIILRIGENLDLVKEKLISQNIIPQQYDFNPDYYPVNNSNNSRSVKKVVIGASVAYGVFKILQVLFGGDDKK